MIVISHLHGDHYGGIPFMIIGSQLMFKRTNPLTIWGPPGTEKILISAMDALFPGSSGGETRFALQIREYEAQQEITTGDLKISPIMNYHSQVGVSFALRVETGGKIIAYSGDTEWTDTLFKAAGDADLFIAEAYFYEKKVKGHMDYKSLIGNYPLTGAKRLILTHMSNDMLSNLDRANCEFAEDEKVFII